MTIANHPQIMTDGSLTEAAIVADVAPADNDQSVNSELNEPKIASADTTAGVPISELLDDIFGGGGVPAASVESECKTATGPNRIKQDSRPDSTGPNRTFSKSAPHSEFGGPAPCSKCNSPTFWLSTFEPDSPKCATCEPWPYRSVVSAVLAIVTLPGGELDWRRLPPFWLGSPADGVGVDGRDGTDGTDEAIEHNSKPATPRMSVRPPTFPDGRKLSPAELADFLSKHDWITNEGRGFWRRKSWLWKEWGEGSKFLRSDTFRYGWKFNDE